MSLSVAEGRVREYIDYHKVSYEIKDIDPSYLMLLYVADRFELNVEQRYWLSFLYSITYNASTVYYIYNEFPDYAGVNVARMADWWGKNKAVLDFQTDCRWIKSRNQFVAIVEAYKLICGKSQESTYAGLTKGVSEEGGYGNCFVYFGRLPWVGRFRLFLLLESVHVVAGLNIKPDGLPLRTAESSRNGLCFAIGADHLLTGKDYARGKLSAQEFQFLDQKYKELEELMKREMPSARIDAWNVETTLCAYKKYKRGKRFPGYYICRQGKEIDSMANKVRDGVCWQVLWDFRKETYPFALLQEESGQQMILGKECAKFSNRNGLRALLR